MPETAIYPVAGAALSREQPFPGLRPYGEEDASWFFGRSGEINDLLKRLRRLHFLAIVGASGSGKSSLVRAGVLPQIRDGYLDAEWRIATFRPGEHPIAHLAEALGAEIDRDPAELASTLRSGPLGLVRALQEAKLPGDGRVLILVDQFEELFQFAQRTGDSAQEEIKEFLKLLLTAASSDEVAVYVVLTMRLEWLNECATYVGLSEAINEGIYLVPQMRRRQFGQGILGPLELADGSLTSALLDRMLNDLDNRTDQLPVLQHALLRLWERNGAREAFDTRAYEAIGTFSNCLSAHAEEVYGELSEREKQVAELLFRTITQVNKNRKIRRPRPIDEIMRSTRVGFDELTAVVLAFNKPGRSFLVTTEGVLTPESIVDISHEALIRQWVRLSDWVDNEAETQARLRRLGEDAAEWDSDRAGMKACLYNGSRLLRAEELVPALDPASTAAAFLRESSRSRFWRLVRRRGWIAVAMLLLVGVAVGLALVSSERAKTLDAQAKLADAQRKEAEVEANVAKLQAKQAQAFQESVVQQIHEANGSATKLAAIAQNIQAQRIYLQVPPGEEQLGRTVQRQLEQHGFAVPPAVQMQIYPPGQTQVIYYNSQDRAEAARIAGLLGQLKVLGGATVLDATHGKALPSGQFEVALSVRRPAMKSPGSEGLVTEHSQPTETPVANKAASSPVVVPVEVVPPALTASLSQDHVQQGRGVTLSWQTENASEVQLEGVGAVELRGSKVFTPQQSATYKLIAKGDGGTTEKSLIVVVTPGSAAVAAPTVAVNSELAEVKAALNRYRDAYESESLDQVKQVWPGVSKAQEKNMKFVFDQFNAVRLTLNCPDDDIRILGDTATASCQQTAVYTQKGKVQPKQAAATTFKLNKNGSRWAVAEIK